ncbi:nuclear pore complex protein Nup93 [Parasteatoda tepidariorum]|uniref:nuclear pore complex protein Nup93 n=1 Tax=Parasteatoda tepidariorum TaxID=114398 RepID=UPI000A2C09A7|nr:nuclear pore complex protein Nup93 [Parasteatoda tepidariorum]XP_042895520.1 nuclear pore complex protein Nup93 [Parasteatoda tepidariorum]
MDSDMSGFTELLQQAEQLTADIDGEGELPRVERNLRQIVDAGQQLWSRTTQAVSKDSCDIKASILLGSKGYDLPKISQKLESLTAARTFEPIEPIRETDIQGFLKNERENAMLSVIEESKKATFAKADKVIWETLQSEWEQEKMKILNALLGPSNELLDVTPDNKSFMSETMNLNSRSTMDNTEMMYAKELSLYNEQVVRGGIKCNLAEKFHSYFKNLDDKKVVELWEMVRIMTDLPLKADKDVLTSRTSLLMKTSLIKQARKYLEEKYFEFIQGIVYGNLLQAELGSRPGAYYNIRSFLKMKIPIPPAGLEDGLIEGNPVWAVLYYCLRCGKIDAAIDAARNAGDCLKDFLPFLIEYGENEEHRLRPNSESQVKLQYRRTVRSSPDPFKRAVFCLLGRVTDDSNPDVMDKTDDYLWMKLCLLRPDEEETGNVPQDSLTFPQLQSQLLEEYGESHFNAYNQPFLYFQVLFLTAQFEAAIEFLFRIDSLRCHAVHIAIVLYELNLLAIPASCNAPLLSKDGKAPMRRLNLSRLLTMYTKKFESTDPREALQYFYVLRDLKSNRGISLFMACISELVLETKEYEMLLGKIEPDGCRKPGAVDKFLTDTQAIIEIVATDSESKGLYEDAIKLYDLAKKHEKVIEILNKLMSQVTPEMNVLGSNRQRLENIALSIAERYKIQGHSANPETSATFFLLLDLMSFFNFYHKNQHTQALDMIKALKLLPFNNQEVEQKVTAFSTYSEEVRRNFPDILLATMNILYAEYKRAKQSGTSNQDSRFLNENANKEKFICFLRTQASALITFAGMIPYRMPGDTNARLVQIEVLMI